MQRGLITKSLSLHMRCASFEGESDRNEGIVGDLPSDGEEEGGLKLLGDGSGKAMQMLCSSSSGSSSSPLSMAVAVSAME